jgi:protocatechuate 3,4-dioxygenase beta subunit
MTRDAIGPVTRQLAQALLVFPIAAAIGFLGRSVSGASSSPAPEIVHQAASDCAVDDPTPVTDSRHFTAGSPERTTFVESGLTGDVLTVTGRVLTAGCTPIAGARLEFWQADEHGRYDSAGFRLRGHQYTDADGRFSLTTIVPGSHAGRAPRIYVRAQAPRTEMLTTQLFVPRDRSAGLDRFVRPELQLDVRRGPDGQIAVFDLVLRPKGVTEKFRFNV